MLKVSRLIPEKYAIIIYHEKFSRINAHKCRKKLHTLTTWNQSEIFIAILTYPVDVFFRNKYKYYYNLISDFA